MFRFYTLLTTFFAFLLFMGGCDKLIYDQYPDGESGGIDGKASKVYLSINHGGAASFRSSSELLDDPTINKDETDYEDWVHDLALFVFDYETCELVTKYFDEGNNNNKITNSFVIELTPGQRDFYFVANMPASGFSAITDKTSMNKYMAEINTLDSVLYEKAIQTKGFPMARVYTNQTVSEGGTVYQPAPFKPNGENQVLLVRVVAKLEVQINEDEFESVESITLKNAYQDYHLQHGTVDGDVVINGAELGNIVHYEHDIALTKNETKKSFYAYMPEALMTDASWTNAEHKPINYFVIKTTSNKTFEVPIITANKDYSFTENYLTYAKSNEDQDKYNIFRNRKYHYQVKNLSDIEVAYKVNEWQYVPTSLYMGYGYNVEVDPDGNIKITNTIDDCIPHKVELIATSPAKFILDDDSEVDKVVYGYSSKTDDGFTEAQMKTGYSESFKINNDAVTTGNPYMEVWYNGTKVKTFTK